MLFVSYEFLGFLLIVFALYYLIPRKFQWQLLLIASYIFYFMADPRYLFYILLTSVSTWGIGVAIDRRSCVQKQYLSEHKAELSKEERKAYKQQVKKVQWRLLLFCLLFNLGILAVLKYTNFTIANINGILHLFGSPRQFDMLNIVLPLGISFYTFQSLGYIIDVYRGTAQAEHNFFRYALFVSFFPQLIQGPISRWNDLSASLYEEHPFEWNTVSLGLQRILWGYFKKMVIADRMLTAVNTIIRDSAQYQGAYVFAGMLFYALELYADFTGGIDITIGIAQVMGIRVTENFHRPYFSKSIKEYWRRWHITMGTWFTDYIFYPISVCKPMLKFSKFARAHFGEAIGKRMPVYLSSFAVWFATGIWHGASWNFIVWGLGNWVVIMVSQELEPFYAKFHARFPSLGSKRIYQGFQVIRTVLLMSCLRMFDCYRDVPLTFHMFGSMVTARNWSVLWNGSLLQLGLSGADFIVLAIGFVILLTVSLVQRSGSVREKIASRPFWVRFLLWYSLFLATLLLGAYGTGYDSSQFIYNQF